ncbi:uncharacterized protein LOC107269430 [Cephus cinctus]|uniref:Uncharacterized protein LOC107269430 n=1 Tax=Cephus cinctus TaxID=211228 RepID=A0AAJ7RL31_CEPCN|nr:uncharacterized protein LOC107269430 [Cephus cinctus]
MKRSLSAPCLAEADNEVKKIKSAAETLQPNGREYLQLALAKVLELQRQIKDDSYITDNTSDLGESDSEEDLMKEVLTKVFKDLPGSSSTVDSVINRAIRPEPAQLEVVRGKSIQLSGYDMCRRVAVDFMRNVVKYTPRNREDAEKFHVGKYSRVATKMANRRTGLLVEQNAQNVNLRQMDANSQDIQRENLSTEYEVRIRMLKGLDLHLAVKQRDYTARLMRQ